MALPDAGADAGKNGGTNPDAGTPPDGAATPDGGGSRCTLEGAVLALDFEDAGSAKALDGSGSGNHGSVSGAVQVPGVHGSALAFGAAAPGMTATSSVVVENSSSLDVSGSSFTLAFWINIRTPLPSSGDEVVLWKPWTAGMSAPPYVQFGVEVNSDDTKQVEFYVGTADGEKTVLRVSAPFDEWAHVAFTLRDDTAVAYLNGVAGPEAAGAPALTARGAAVSIGVDATGAQPFNGMLDELRIYRRALSADEIHCLASR